MAIKNKTKAVVSDVDGAENEYTRQILALRLTKGKESAVQSQNTASEAQIITNSKYSAAIVPPAKLDIACSEDGMSSQDLINSNKEIIVAINGGYYDILNSHLCPIGLLVSDGVLIWASSLKVAQGEDEERKQFSLKAQRESEWYMTFFVNKDGKAGILPINELVARTNSDYDDLQMACEAGPSILASGKVNSIEISKRDTGGVLDARTAIGICENGDVVLFCSKEKMTLYDVANEMRNIGAVDAIALDGGPEVSFEAPKNPDASISGGSTFMIIYVKP